SVPAVGSGSNSRSAPWIPRRTARASPMEPAAAAVTNPGLRRQRGVSPFQISDAEADMRERDCRENNESIRLSTGLPPPSLEKPGFVARFSQDAAAPSRAELEVPALRNSPRRAAGFIPAESRSRRIALTAQCRRRTRAMDDSN